MDESVNRSPAQEVIIFPRDCSRNCPHFHTWDMSIDDWTSVCDLLKIQIDDCDMNYRYEICPNNGADMRAGEDESD